VLGGGNPLSANFQVAPGESGSFLNHLNVVVFSKGKRGPKPKVQARLAEPKEPQQKSRRSSGWPPAQQPSLPQNLNGFVESIPVPGLQTVTNVLLSVSTAVLDEFCRKRFGDFGAFHGCLGGCFD